MGYAVQSSQLVRSKSPTADVSSGVILKMEWPRFGECRRGAASATYVGEGERPSICPLLSAAPSLSIEE